MRTKRVGIRASIGAIIMGLALPAASYEVVPVTDGGSISGTISLSGPVPEPRRFKVEKTPEVCGTEDRLVAWGGSARL